MLPLWCAIHLQGGLQACGRVCGDERADGARHLALQWLESAQSLQAIGFLTNTGVHIVMCALYLPALRHTALLLLSRPHHAESRACIPPHSLHTTPRTRCGCISVSLRNCTPRYTYYFLTSIGIKPSWKKLVTNVQIFQFLLRCGSEAPP